MEKSPFDEVPELIRRKGEAESTVGSLRPGSVCRVVYTNKAGTGRRVTNKEMTLLIVSNNRSGLGSGVYSHTNKKFIGDKYLSCFVLDGLSFESVQTITGSINKYGTLLTDRQKVRSYKYIKNLFGTLLGRKKYRTLSISMGGVSNVRRYDVEFISNQMI